MLDFSVSVHFLSVCGIMYTSFNASQCFGITLLLTHIISLIEIQVECRGREDYGILHFALVLFLDCIYTSTNYVSLLGEKIPQILSSLLLNITEH